MLFDRGQKHELQHERIVFFSDAVFAIAITLLIIEVKVPHLEHGATNRDFIISLINLLPNLVGYFFSFFVIGAYWIGHHRIYGMIVDWDYGLLWRNIYFLMSIAFMPFVTAFFSEYPAEFVPLALYSLTFAIAGILEIMQYRYAYQRNLVDPSITERDYKYYVWRMSVLPLTGLAAVAVGAAAKPIYAGIAFMFIPLAYRVIRYKFNNVEAAEESSAQENT